jgi:hypothetical protein
VRSKVVHYLDFGPCHFFWLVGIFLSAAIASGGYLFREHRWRRVGIGFAEPNGMLVRGIAFVMDAMICR